MKVIGRYREVWNRIKYLSKQKDNDADYSDGD